MIDYNIISESISYYQQKGFTRIESPWTVSKDIVELTKPKNKIAYKLEHNQKCLVGSGEQSFLYLYNKGFLPKGKFQTVTPCFRDDCFSLIHTKYFIKNELIITDEVNQTNLSWIITQCKQLFEALLKEEVLIEKTDIGYDLVCKGIELGSYGIRENPILKYIYGTGVAEPRLSYCLNYKP